MKASGLSEKADNFIKTIPTDEWIKILNTIRRGRYYGRQEDLDYANDLLLPYMVKADLWDGEKGEPIDIETCNELWKYIAAITEEQKVF